MPHRYRTPRGHDLGRALTLINKFWQGCSLDDEFSRAMGAPMGELRPLINRSRAKEFRHIKRQVRSLTGLSWRAFSAEVERRTCGRYVHFYSNIGREHEFVRHPGDGRF